MYLLVICELLGLFASTLAGDDKYSLRNSQDFPQPIQMKFSKKEKTFFQFIAPFLKSTSNFEYFEKKDDPQSSCMSEITDCKRCG